MTYRILVTGSRAWTDRDSVFGALDDELELLAGRDGTTEVVVVHGGCPTGADAAAGDYVDAMVDWARRRGLTLVEEVHPADWERHGRAAGFVRNEQMVKAGADVCLAFIRCASPGATHCADRAERAGIPTARTRCG